MFSKEALGDCIPSYSRGGASGAAPCTACDATSKLPSFSVEANYLIGGAFSIDATTYANGLDAPYTGCTRSTHELWVSLAGQPSSTGYKAATVVQEVTGTDTVTFSGTVTSAWLNGGSDPGTIYIWVRSYDDCNGSYEEDFAEAGIFSFPG